MVLLCSREFCLLDHHVLTIGIKS
jgi:hypothetical protein